jgi:hypothetical protein
MRRWRFSVRGLAAGMGVVSVDLALIRAMILDPEAFGVAVPGGLVALTLFLALAYGLAVTPSARSAYRVGLVLTGLALTPMVPIYVEALRAPMSVVFDWMIKMAMTRVLAIGSGAPPVWFRIGFVVFVLLILNVAVGGVWLLAAIGGGRVAAACSGGAVARRGVIDRRHVGEPGTRAGDESGPGA